MVRLIAFLAGAGSLVLGVLSRFTEVSLPVDCSRVLCTVAGTVITADMVLMGGGILLVILAMAARDSQHLGD